MLAILYQSGKLYNAENLEYIQLENKTDIDEVYCNDKMQRVPQTKIL